MWVSSAKGYAQFFDALFFFPAHFRALGSFLRIFTDIIENISVTGDRSEVVSCIIWCALYLGAALE